MLLNRGSKIHLYVCAAELSTAVLGSEINLWFWIFVPMWITLYIWGCAWLVKEKEQKLGALSSIPGSTPIHCVTVGKSLKLSLG